MSKVKVRKVQNLYIDKIAYKSYYKDNQIYYISKIYFQHHKHTYYMLSKPYYISVGDIVDIIYFKKSNKRYLKSMQYNQPIVSN